MQELTWDAVRDDVLKVNADFAKVVDELSPDRGHTVFKVKYPFGSEILRRGNLYLPTDSGEIVPFDGPEVSDHIKESLGYNFGSNPASLVLRNSLELFVTMDDRIMPYSLIVPGDIFGLWKTLDVGVSHCPETFLWGLTAGARSLFMLPKISDVASYNKIKQKYQLDTDTPRCLMDQWGLFKELANHASNDSFWEVELLFFSKAWLEHKGDDAWLKFNYYLLDSAWQGSSYWRNQYIWGLVFSSIHNKRSIKPSLYIAGLVKHLLSMGIGAVPGFQPAIDDSFGPIKLLQQIFIDDYGIKYPPIIMQPGYFSMLEQSSRSIYCSLQHPTALEFSLKPSNKSTTLSDLYDVRSLLRKYLDEIIQGDLNISTTPLYDMAEKVAFDFFHSKTSNYSDIRSSEEIPAEDPTFMQTFMNTDYKLFPKHSNFVNGCVRVTSKNNH